LWIVEYCQQLQTDSVMNLMQTLTSG